MGKEELSATGKGRQVEGMNTKDWLADLSYSRDCVRPALNSLKIHEDIFLWCLWNYPPGVLPNQPSENHKGQGKRKPLCQHSSALYSQNVLCLIKSFWKQSAIDKTPI